VIEATASGSAIGPALALLVVLFLAQALVQGLAQFVLARTGEGIVLGIRLGLIKHVLRLSSRCCTASRWRRCPHSGRRAR
jgi:hypothetical protein